MIFIHIEKLTLHKPLIFK